MSKETRIRHAGSAATAFTVTNLHGLADTNIWRSGAITNTNPANMAVRIFFHLDWDVAPVVGDNFKFYVSYSSEEGTAKWTGGIANTEGQITVAADKIKIRQACPNVFTYTMTDTTQTGHFGHFDIFYPGPQWQLLIEAAGEAIEPTGTPSLVSYRYFTPER
jgi:hypothetical protein